MMRFLNILDMLGVNQFKSQSQRTMGQALLELEVYY